MVLKKTIARTLTATLLGICASGARGTAESVRITHNQPFPPFAEIKNGKSEGLAIDILRAAAERVGIELEFVAAPIEEMVQTLQDGRADALLQAPTPERMKSFDFSAAVVTTGAALYVRAPHPTPENLLALSGKVVVTPRTGPLAANIARIAPTVHLSVTADYESSLARVVEGTADAAALNYHVGAIIAHRIYPGQITMPDRMFQEGQLAVAVRKGQFADVLTRLNAGLDGIRADGTWQRINARWAAP